ncbi:sensor domain-containing diguanylate cyclase [Leptospira sp. GIMC2001]|uniref:sensor domain-containing diguanylate cyclase n=1 Tax=Leptospira sp. GIMC2001 TaxID=1513297 RepID=UPI00234A80B4|nr:sensor domain-containing diguanylate cyclase [Leptospira sp. GIMC2001]WCL48001.1 sensor domain-containing diguanylate cyclase [Leptospira sp. GIMC2001]
MNILILDESSKNAERIKTGLIDANLVFKLEIGINWESAIELLQTQVWSSIVCNENFAQKPWKDLLLYIRKIFPSTNLTFIVEKDFKNSLEILKAGADDILYLDDLERFSYILKREIYSQKEAERKGLLLTQLENSFREIQFQKFSLDQAAIVSISDKDGNLSYVNDKFCKISGYKREEVTGKSHRILDANSHDSIFWDNFYSTISNGKVWNGEIKNKKKDGSYYWVDMTLVPFIDASNKAYKYVAIQFDITNRILAEEQLTRDAFYDPLTELPNRALFLTKIEQQIFNRNINRNIKIAIVIINLDRFKRINNSMGFYAGDLLINRLKEIFVSLETNILISTARLGGDSFGFLLSGTELDKILVQQFIDQIKTILERPIQILDKEIFVTFSSGVAFLGEGGSDGEELAKNAEIAMFQSKETSKSDLVFFIQVC